MLDCRQEDGLRRFALEESKHVLKRERIIRHKMKRLDKINDNYTIVFKEDCLDSFKELSCLNPKDFHFLFSDWDSRHPFANLIELSSNGRPRLVGGGLSTETQLEKVGDLREELQEYFISLTDLDHPVKPYDITSVVSVNGDTMSEEIRKRIKQGFKIKRKQIESLKVNTNALPVTPMTTMTTTRSMRLREVTPPTSTSKYFKRPSMEQFQSRQNNSQNDLRVEDLRGCIKDKIKEMKMALSHLRKQAGHASDCRETINRLDNKSQPENQKDKSMTLRSSASKNSPAKSSPPNRGTRSSPRQSAKSRESIVAVSVSFGKEIDLRSDRELESQGGVRGPLETYWLDLIRQGMELTKK